MTTEYDPGELSTHAAHLAEFTDAVESQVSSKVAESPNILAYGLLCMGVVGWWMQLGQADAQRLVKSTAGAIDYVHQGMVDVVKMYEEQNAGNQAIADRLGQIARDIPNV